MPADIESMAAQVTAQLEGGTTSPPAPAEAGSGTADGGSALTPSPAPALPAPASAETGEIKPAADAPAPSADPTGETKPAVTDPPAPNEAPSSWKPEEKALWEGLPEQVRAVVLRREADFHRGYQAVRQQADTGQKFVETLQPFLADIAQQRLDPFQVTRNLWAAQKTLALGTPEAKLSMFQQLAKDYGIDLRQVAGGNPDDAPFVDQETVNLRNQVTALNNELQSFKQERLSTKQASAKKELDAFFADKTAHEFSDQAAGQMATLLTADPNLTLKDAYEKAIWMVPEIRDILLTRQQAKAKAEAEKALQAQKLQAASSVQVGNSPGSVTAPADNLSLEDTTAAALRAIRANQRN